METCLRTGLVDGHALSLGGLSCGAGSRPRRATSFLAGKRTIRGSLGVKLPPFETKDPGAQPVEPGGQAGLQGRSVIALEGWAPSLGRMPWWCAVAGTLPARLKVSEDWASASAGKGCPAIAARPPARSIIEPSSRSIAASKIQGFFLIQFISSGQHPDLGLHAGIREASQRIVLSSMLQNRTWHSLRQVNFCACLCGGSHQGCEGEAQAVRSENSYSRLPC